ncbi:hypothetical protein FAZ97_27135 [Paraburkholderia acidiphila]|uniref:PNPLA domain-containing protein n=2 Tax=Paraburkholderia acidiphila TaxID=2571747 RepID=A0A7Z2GCL4_9BURK|nr:hypothetical protein FAZ97_27135 [Paraburkholderia acidiphila]
MLEAEFKLLHPNASRTSIAPNASIEEREHALRRDIHGLPGDQVQCALCLSGGGIRSATFCLGVLQGLAKRGLLQNFHYLSTVSGGGYIGAWLTSWIQRTTLGNVLTALGHPPPPTNGPPGALHQPEPEEIRNLRAYSNYLSPVWGMSADLFTLIMTFARNLLLNWLVFVPLLLAAVAVPRLWLLSLHLQGGSVRVPLLAAGGLIAIGHGYMIGDMTGKPSTDTKEVRNWFLLCSFAPLCLAAVLLSWAATQQDLQTAGSQPGNLVWFACSGAVVQAVAVPVGFLVRRLRGIEPIHYPPRLWVILAIVGSGAVVAAGYFALVRYFAPPVARLRADPVMLTNYAVWSFPLVVCGLWIASVLQAGATGPLTRGNAQKLSQGVPRPPGMEAYREWWARASAYYFLAVVGWIGMFSIVTYAVLFLLDSGADRLSHVGLSGGLIGVAVSLAGYWSKTTATLKKRAPSLAAVARTRVLQISAAAFIVVLLIVLSYCVNVAIGVLRGDSDWDTKVGYARILTDTNCLYLLIACVFAVAFAFFVSAAIGANTFSLHNLYGNRLVRAYLGATNAQRNPQWFTNFDDNDNWSMNPKAPPFPLPPPPPRPPTRRLYPVVNTALNLAKPSKRRLAWQQRKATSFIISPLFTGSSTIGYVPTTGYADITLGRAMTISGAAASPNMGYHTSGLVAFVMTLFNVRLGWWLPSPRFGTASGLHRRNPIFGIMPLLREAFATSSDNNEHVYLSDGGHFENLGLYEMVRRRCRRIVVVDAAADPQYAYADLENAIRKIRIDFGISITFPMPLPTPSVGPGAIARRVRIGAIGYSAVDAGQLDGQLILIKPVLFGDEPVDVCSYAATSKVPGGAFPQETTADQFFTEAQFESYRMLGEHTVLNTFKKYGQWAVANPALSVALARPPASVPAPAPASAAAADDEANATKGSAFAQWLQSIGHNAVLASALAATGAAGVVATHLPSVISPKAPDTQPGEKPPGKVAPGSPDTSGLPARLETLQNSTERLSVAIDRLIVALQPQPQPQPDSPDPALAGQIGALAQSINALQASITKLQSPAWSSTDVTTQLRLLAELTQRVDKVSATLAAQNPSSNAAATLAELTLIKAQLDTLTRSVNALSPQNYVRGGLQ